ncbi:hypothetical protein BDW02DRAFT_495992 [Decorospora gaudefroyi]|uniref:DUF7730 domain-containing protein n=1 Tax=Decorospora gaudefroyi TaxID=184978 RepID=A0A6A5KHJ0_9PLEO|nr:hypothetical protein BDW02DRAFT_495992 [Decorospora gaudefroyi]
MARQKPNQKNQASTSKAFEPFTRAKVAKRRNNKLRFAQNGLLDVEPKAGKYLKIARQNQQDSPLLRLPPEIRNRIFGYVLGGKTFHIEYSVNTETITNTTKSEHALSPLAVCRQVFAETALLPFSLNTFRTFSPRIFNEWIANFPPAYAEVITCVGLKIRLRRNGHSISQLLEESELQSGRFSPALSSLQRVDLLLTVTTHFAPELLLGASALFKLEKKESRSWVKKCIEASNEGITLTLTRKMGSKPGMFVVPMELMLSSN